MEHQLFIQYLLFGLGVLALLALAAPTLIWRNTSETTRLLRELLEEQETANDLNAAILRRLERIEQRLPPAAPEITVEAPPPPGPDDDFGPDEDWTAEERECEDASTKDRDAEPS